MKNTDKNTDKNKIPHNLLMRQIHTLQLLSLPDGIFGQDLQEKLKVSRFTLKRILDAIREAGIPVESFRKKGFNGKFYRISPRHIQGQNENFPLVRLNWDEILLLQMLLSSGKIFEGTDFSKSLESLKSKMKVLVGQGAVKDQEWLKVSDIFRFAELTKNYSEKETLIEDLMNALIRSHVCSVTYRAFEHQQRKKYRIHPLYLFQRKGGLYLIVRVPKYPQDNIRILAVERIDDLFLFESETFKHPEGFDPEEYLAGAFGVTVGEKEIPVRLCFAASRARYVEERTWVPGQKFYSLLDGRLVMEFNATGLIEIKQWILSWGADVQVLSPPELRDEIKNELARNLRENYGYSRVRKLRNIRARKKRNLQKYRQKADENGLFLKL